PDLRARLAADDRQAPVQRAASEADYRFGGRFWVVLDDGGEPRPVNVQPGITDLERVATVSGLAESDRELILPSAHLVETQQQLQEFISRRTGGVPGIGAR